MIGLHVISDKVHGLTSSGGVAIEQVLHEHSCLHTSQHLWIGEGILISSFASNTRMSNLRQHNPEFL